MDNTSSLAFIDEYNSLFEHSWSDDTPADQVRFVVLDSETTGTDSRTAKLITIGAVAVSGVEEPQALEAFLKYLKDGVIVGHHIGHDITTIDRATDRHFGIKLHNQSLD